jgi:hypothetical protein
VEKYLEVVEQAAALNLKITSYQILGLPGESLESMVQTLCFAARLPVLIGASMFYLPPNSPIARVLGREANPQDIFTARLSAMAWETEGLRREDLYTLFVSTRILDFLKGWSSVNGSDIFLNRILEDETEVGDRRGKIGLRILRELFRSKTLYAWTARGLQPLKRFNSDLFFSIWKNLEWIQTQEGNRMWLWGEPCVRPPG